MGKIVVVGSSNTDMIVNVREMPRAGETVLGGTFFMAAGGKGANQAVAAARAGGDVTFVGCVGADLFGRQAVQQLTDDGIDTGFVFTEEGAASGVALILVDGTGENSIAVAAGANAMLRPAHLVRAEPAIRAADALVLQLETPLETVEAAARMAAERGVKVILNPAPAQPLDRELLRHVSILTPNETEAEALTGVGIGDDASLNEAASVLLSAGPDAVLITLGAHGVFVATAGVRERVPGIGVRAVDTTAAGDVFNGALAAALTEDRPLLEAVRFANAAAALSVTRLGAQPSVPHREEISSLLSGNGHVAID
ncbi:MAG TPA: ribokinase [Longimicrobiaceae bacterium]|nr:ribokinase [Longimicrobiaceae bacterium]